MGKTQKFKQGTRAYIVKGTEWLEVVVQKKKKNSRKWPVLILKNGEKALFRSSELKSKSEYEAAHANANNASWLERLSTGASSSTAERFGGLIQSAYDFMATSVGVAGAEGGVGTVAATLPLPASNVANRDEEDLEPEEEAPSEGEDMSDLEE